MKKDKYGRQYNRPVYGFAVVLILIALLAIVAMKCNAA